MAAVLQLTCLLSGRGRGPQLSDLSSACHFISPPQPCLLSVAISAAAGCRMDKERKCSQLLPRSIVVARAGEGAVTSTVVAQEVESVWKGQASEVMLTGDFLCWEHKLPLEKGTNGTFITKQRLAPGRYKYKFIVDGQWMHSPDFPTVPDGKGGLNNEIAVKGASAELESLPVATPPKVELSKVEAAPTCNPKLNATVTAKTTGTKAIAKKPVQKSLASLMSEDIIPALQKELEKQEGISDLSLKFADNQGDFEKNGIRYSFWAYFPDGTLEGSRGFSLSSHGCPPSTIEPFLIDEKKITANLVVFWVMKRLFAQKLLSQN
ncbi:hypothetical protein O6H91_04G031500 [Diphasiastrum complanatum]|uniref:Uncharacterized protein n=1 Tax=Diphasiastrum complanatum TaxID=34168 RepID=A0ACC2DVM9_DIPCM|nr:hypothetical protein O6H91_Y200200 [Diphasiastrum complanatum]KAJ7558274.1 hypothetical protein O6H91_04G031500 [Diphasiastrum complanatum]